MILFNAKRANRTKVRVTSWLNYSKSIEPRIDRLLAWFEVLGIGLNHGGLGVFSKRQV